jgi:hypothetical protein
MFRCERCGSRYSALNAATMANCPRCKVRDQISVPLYFKVFRLPGDEDGTAPLQQAEPPNEDRPYPRVPFSRSTSVGGSQPSDHREVTHVGGQQLGV